MIQPNKITFLVRRGEFQKLEIKGSATENLTHFAMAVNTIIDNYSLKMSKDKRLQKVSKTDLQQLFMDMLLDLFKENKEVAQSD